MKLSQDSRPPRGRHERMIQRSLECNLSTRYPEQKKKENQTKNETKKESRNSHGTEEQGMQTRTSLIDAQRN